MLFETLQEAINADLAEKDSQSIDCPYKHHRHYDDITVRAKSSLSRSLGSKYRGERLGLNSTKEERRLTALERFMSSNRRCDRLNASFPQLVSELPDLVLTILGEAQVLISTVMSELDAKLADPAMLGLRASVGPGKALGSEWNDLYAKAFNGPLLFPSETALYLWSSTNDSHLSRWEAELFRKSQFGAPLIHKVAKITTVAKNSATDRTIVISTNGGALLQRALGLYLEDVLMRLGLDIETQPLRNAYLAKVGSVWQDDMSPATIDLTDASDLIYVELVKYLFMFCPNVLRCMLAVRESGGATSLPDGSPTTTVILGMMGTMGNGFTFPLQTLIFWALTVATCKVEEIPLRYRYDGNYVGTVGVFGDDIILPAKGYGSLIRVLKLLGMKPNDAKSYGYGPFRESCGSDFAHGINIRGVYAKDLSAPHQLVSLFNTLADWSARHGIPLNRGLRVLYDHLPPNRRNGVPLWEGDCAGIRIPASMYVSRCSKTLRIHLGVQSTEYIYRPWRVVPSTRVVDDGPGGFEVIKMDKDGDNRPVHTFFRVNNPVGLLFLHLDSRLATPTITIRSDVYVDKLDNHVVTYAWDYVPHIRVSVTGLLRWGLVGVKKHLPLDEKGRCHDLTDTEYMNSYPWPGPGHVERLATVLRKALIRAVAS